MRTDQEITQEIHRVSRLGLYRWAALLLSTLGASGLALLVSVHLSGEALKREQQQREQARQATCLVVKRMINVYSDPSTETGRNAAVAWRGLGVQFRCEG